MLGVQIFCLEGNEGAVWLRPKLCFFFRPRQRSIWIKKKDIYVICFNACKVWRKLVRVFRLKSYVIFSIEEKHFLPKYHKIKIRETVTLRVNLIRLLLFITFHQNYIYTARFQGFVDNCIESASLSVNVTIYNLKKKKTKKRKEKRS